MKRSEEIINILSEHITPKCELDFKNNYQLLCAVMLSAQTTDKSVNLVTPELFLKYPSFVELAKANIVDISNIIKRLGLVTKKSENLIGIAKTIIEKFDGNIPNTLSELTTLPGVGRKTASVVLALGFNIPEFPVDTHVSRVAKRLSMAKESDDVLEIEEKLRRNIKKEMWIDSHHLMLLFGRYHCTSKNPKCEECYLKAYCKYKA